MKRLLKIISEIQPVVKDKENPFFKSMYFDINKLLAVLKPMFLKEGLVVSQPLGTKDGRPTLNTIVYDLKTGELVNLDTVVLPDLLDPQKMGAVITYYRRYMLKSMLGVEDEDYDGNTKKEVKDAQINVASLVKKIQAVKTATKLNSWIKYVSGLTLAPASKNVLKKVLQEQSKKIK